MLAIKENWVFFLDTRVFRKVDHSGSEARIVSE